MRDKPIYVITTITNEFADKTRSVGFEHTFSGPESTVLKNTSDISEGGYYGWAVIEETYPGLYSLPRNEYWYRWDVEQKKYIHTDKPKNLSRVVFFGLG